MTEPAGTSPFFRSRWIERPPHVTELEPTGLPAGFRAAGVAAGIKPKGLDVGLLVSDAPDTVSSARFTASAVVGAPVAVSQRASLGRLRAVVASSGNANVADGARGIETAAAAQSAAAERLGLEPGQVGVAATGVIGRELPRDRLLAGLDRAAAELGPDAGAFSEALMTTDRGSKRACLEVDAAIGAGSPVGPGEGRRDDLARLRHGAVLHADRRRARAGHDRPPDGRHGQALAGADLGRRPAVHERHGVLPGERRVGRPRGAGGRRRAGARRGHGRAAATARARGRRRWRGCAARGPGDRPRRGGGGGARGPRGGRLAARQDGAARSGTELRPRARGRGAGAGRRAGRNAPGAR